MVGHERRHETILLTGGAGFVGSNLALWFKGREPQRRVIALDNLKRRGSEMNLPRLRAGGVEFVHGDVRNPEDLPFGAGEVDLIIECSAEPSVLAGYGGAPDYVINTNLLGTINCLELARRANADVVFLSTSRVYPVQSLNDIVTTEEASRFVVAPGQTMPGISERGISEEFPLAGARSLYGATKLCSELIIQEYGAMYGVRAIINRCGNLTGPWQMGKVDQGVFALWVGKHHFGSELGYIGWGGTGKQVRDLLHVEDLAELLDREIANFDALGGQTFNVGGGIASSLSLVEATDLCREITGRRIPVHAITDDRPADVKLYITDTTRVRRATGWSPRHTPRETLTAIHEWIKDAESDVRHLWAG